MNSFNHYAYGAIGEWLYSYVAGLGIDIENPGYKHILFSPHPGGGLTNASTTFQSMYGEIVSEWKIEDGRFIYSVVVPANTTATVTLPNAETATVTVDTIPVSDRFGSKVKQVNDSVVVELGSGKYSFSYPVKEL
jgi:alpha-L-rhamnosidase